MLLAAFVGVVSLVGWRTAAAADPNDSGPDHGMQGMHELMESDVPGMERMHELMESDVPGMARMHERMLANPNGRGVHEQMTQRGGMADMEDMMNGDGGS